MENVPGVRSQLGLKTCEFRVHLFVKGKEGDSRDRA